MNKYKIVQNRAPRENPWDKKIVPWDRSKNFVPWDGMSKKNFSPIPSHGTLFKRIPSHPSHGMGWDGMGWDSPIPRGALLNTI